LVKIYCLEGNNMAIEPNYDDILKIVKDYNERDDIFYKRALGAQRKTLFFKFWDKHFEWNDLVNDFPEINGHILDFGCGSGHSDILMAEKGHKVHGIDISETGIAIAKHLRSLQPKKVQKNIFSTTSDSSANFKSRISNSLKKGDKL